MNKKLLIALCSIVLAPAAFAGNEHITISTQLVASKKEGPVVLPAVVVPVGMEGTTEATKPFRYVTRFDPPKNVSTDGHAVVVPMTPAEFTDAKPGWIIEYNAQVTGGIITLVGTAHYTEAQIGKGVYGENSGPIYADKQKKIVLTANMGNSASTLTSSTHFQIFAKPGEKYEIKVRKLDQWVTCVISCDLAVKTAKN